MPLSKFRWPKMPWW